MNEWIKALRKEAVAIPRSGLSAPVLSYLTEEERWRLEAAYRYQAGAFRIEIPQGFVFDLASVPRVFWWVISPFELSVVAPLIHDFLYRHQGNPPLGAIEPPRAYSREETDWLFKAIMREEGVAAWRCRLAFWATRLFGGATW